MRLISGIERKFGLIPGESVPDKYQVDCFTLSYAESRRGKRFAIYDLRNSAINQRKPARKKSLTTSPPFFHSLTSFIQHPATECGFECGGNVSALKSPDSTYRKYIGLTSG